jgi:alkylhydroperoxidase family enzyme
MGFLSLGRALLTQTRLDPGLRELAILRVGALSNAGYEIHQHRKVARQVGLTDAEVNAVLSPPAVGDLAPRQRLVVDFTDALVRDVKVAPVLNEMVIGEFSGQIWLELQMIVGYYMLVSRVLENLEVDIEDDDIDKLELPNG